MVQMMMDQLFGLTSCCSTEVWFSILFFSTEDPVIWFGGHRFVVIKLWVCNVCSCLIVNIYCKSLGSITSGYIRPYSMCISSRYTKLTCCRLMLHILYKWSISHDFILSNLAGSCPHIEYNSSLIWSLIHVSMKFCSYGKYLMDLVCHKMN